MEKKKKNLKIALILMVLLLAIPPSFIVNSESPSISKDDLPQPYIYTYMPENSFGINEFKTINWTFFKNLFNSHTDWVLQYKHYSYSEWENGNEYLTINKSWNDTGFWKIGLGFDVPVDIYQARFIFSCDLQVLDYVEREGFEVWLNYTVPDTSEIYNLFFNFSDIASIPNIEFDKGRTDNKFWFMFQRFNIPSGNYYFDPTFGDLVYSTSYAQVAGGDIYGSVYTMNDEDGLAKNMSFVTGYLNPPDEIKGIIYNSDGTEIIGETECRTDLGDNSQYKVITLDFSEPYPFLSANTDYVLALFGDGTYYYYRTVETSIYERYQDANYNADVCNAELGSEEFAHYTDTYGYACICGYEITGNIPPVINNNSISNGTINSDIVSSYCVNISDYEGNNTNGSIECSTGDNTSWNNQPNGTFCLNLTNIIYCTNYTIWVNVTDGEDWTNESFWFMTKCYEFFITNENPLNNSDTNCIYLESICVDINNTIGLTSGWVNISINNTIFSNVSYTGNDTYCLDLTSVNLTNLESYKWYVNVSYYNESIDNSSWFNFTCVGCGCYDELIVVINKLNQIIDNMIMESDNLNIGIDANLIMLLIWMFLAWIIFKSRSVLESLPVGVCFIALSGIMISSDLFQGIIFIVISTAIFSINLIRLFQKT